MDKLRVGVIGAGSFGEAHIAAYQALPLAQLVAIAEPRKERIEELRSRYSIPEAYDNYQDLCARSDLDIISVVTPESDHVDPTVAALESGKHVILEKPIATTEADAQKMLEARDRSGRYLMLGHLLRFEPKYATVKRLIEKGHLGKVHSIHARRNRSRSLSRVYAARVHALLVNAIHDIDICLWYIQDRVQRVRGVTRNVQGNEHPDINWGFLEFEGGAVVSLETHWLIPEKVGISTDDQMQIIGSRGIANVDQVHSGLSLWREEGIEISNVSYDSWFHGQIHGPVLEELGYFLECVRQGKPPEVITGEEALQALKVSLALIDSSEQGGAILEI